MDCVLNLKFVYSEKATKFCEISTLLLSTVHTDKSKVDISQNFVAFSEYMIFKNATPDDKSPHCLSALSSSIVKGSW